MNDIQLTLAICRPNKVKSVGISTLRDWIKDSTHARRSFAKQHLLHFDSSVENFARTVRIARMAQM